MTPMKHMCWNGNALQRATAVLKRLAAPARQQKLSRPYWKMKMTQMTTMTIHGTNTCSLKCQKTFTQSAMYSFCASSLSRRAQLLSMLTPTPRCHSPLWRTLKASLTAVRPAMDACSPSKETTRLMRSAASTLMRPRPKSTTS